MAASSVAPEKQMASIFSKPAPFNPKAASTSGNTTASIAQPPKQPGVAIDPKMIPWVEKYRPKTIDEVSGQDSVSIVLRKTLMSSNLPHMLFYGPPGTGKTSTILALARQMFGPDAFRSRVLELNASDERGISVVREKIKTFAKETPRAASGTASDGKVYPSPPFKIIILDEADSMTQDAQSALRRIMETYSKITRFCLVCNYVTRIIEPLASRCSKFRFKPLDPTSTHLRVSYIAKEEGIQCDEGVLELLLDLSNGDLRRSITILQSASRLHKAGNDAVPISKVDIQEIAGVVPDELIHLVCRACGIVPGEGYDASSLRKSGGFNQVRDAVKRIGKEGWSAGTVLSQMHDIIILHPAIPARPKSLAAIAMAEADKNLCEGGDEELQMMDCCLAIRKAMAGGA